MFLARQKTLKTKTSVQKDSLLKNQILTKSQKVISTFKIG